MTTIKGKGGKYVINIDGLNYVELIVLMQATALVLPEVSEDIRNYINELGKQK